MSYTWYGLNSNEQEALVEKVTNTRQTGSKCGLTENSLLCNSKQKQNYEHQTKEEEKGEKKKKEDTGGGGGGGMSKRRRVVNQEPGIKDPATLRSLNRYK